MLVYYLKYMTWIKALNLQTSSKANVKSNYLTVGLNLLCAT